MDRASRNIKYSLVAATVLLMLCVLIKPSGLSLNDGFSYYGIYKVTLIPYSLALLITAFFYWKTADLFSGNSLSQKIISFSLKMMAILFVGLNLTPASILEGAHMTFGSILFSAQLILSIWLVILTKSVWPNIILVITQIAAGVAALYYLPKQFGLLLQAQFIFELAFGLLLINVFSKLSEASGPKDQTKQLKIKNQS